MGDAAIINFVKSKVEIAEKTIRDKLSTSIYNAGTDSKQIQGLRLLLSASNTYGGISQSTYAWYALLPFVVAGDVVLIAVAVGLVLIRAVLECFILFPICFVVGIGVSLAEAAEGSTRSDSGSKIFPGPPFTFEPPEWKNFD